MISDYLNQSGYRVAKANHVLYNALSAATLVLTGSLPSVAFRCAVTLSAAGSHTDCAGTVVVGAETVTFAAAAKKLTTTNLSALPVCTSDGLDCIILIEAITTGGAPIQLETQTAIDCRFEPQEEVVQYPVGQFVKQTGIAYVNDSSFVKGSVFSQGGYDYEVFRFKPEMDLDGAEEFRKLWLTGQMAAPTGRATAEECDMLKSVYDTDEDGIVDKAESIRDLDALPASPTEGELVAKDGKMYIAVSSS